MARRRRAARALGALAGLAALLLAAVVAVVWALGRTDPPPAAAVCSARLDGTDWHLSPAQAENAGLIAAVAVRRGLPARAVTIALATALQESDLINVGHGDRDSLGLFQQRPSQGWGTEAEVQDPLHASNAFYDALLRVDGWQDLAITVAAQEVQRSAFPDAYAQHETRARAWASGLTGWSPTTVTCTLAAADAPADRAAAADAVVARLRQDLGDLPAQVDAAAGTVTVDAAALTPDDPARGAAAVAGWAVAVAQPLGLGTVAAGGQEWDRATGAWAPTADGAGLVVLRLP